MGGEKKNGKGRRREGAHVEKEQKRQVEKKEERKMGVCVHVLTQI